MSKYLVYSHGFGVKKDSRGMFTDIAKAFPDYKSVMFNYNDIDVSSGLVTVAPLRTQARILSKQLENIHKQDPDGEVTVIAHSQGCVVLALAQPKVHKAILLTPPDNVSGKRVENYFTKYPGTTIESDGTIRVPRKDGTITRITSDFIADITSINAIEEYSNLANISPTTIIIAKSDEILRPIDFTSLPKSVKLLKIVGDHNFSGEYRTKLISTLKNIVD